MKNQYLKIAIILGFVILLIVILITRVNAQAGTEQLKLLTEISTDIKYIKNDIQEIKTDNRNINGKLINVSTRVTKVEERQTNIRADIYDVTARNNWFLGLIGSLMLLTLGMQIKRSSSHRKNNGNNNNKVN